MDVFFWETSPFGCLHGEGKGIFKVAHCGAGSPLSDGEGGEPGGSGSWRQDSRGCSRLLALCVRFAPQTNEWNKNDDRLLQAVENGDAEKVASLLGKKGASATKHDSEGKTA